MFWSLVNDSLQHLRGGGHFATVEAAPIFRDNPAAAVAEASRLENDRATWYKRLVKDGGCAAQRCGPLGDGRRRVAGVLERVIVTALSAIAVHAVIGVILAEVVFQSGALVATLIFTHSLFVHFTVPFNYCNQYTPMTTQMSTPISNNLLGIW